MNLVQKSVQAGGRISPLIIDSALTQGTGLMNPSIFIDNGELLCNVRLVNYTLYHSEGTQRFISRWGPLAYLHPESDQHLKTRNFLCRLNNNLEITDVAEVEMLQLHEPIWEFHGLEDARLVKWDDKYYLIGVRRDTTPNGQGRMEYSEVVIEDGWKVKEVKRTRIPAPVDPNSYCEKNWVPVIDKPHHFIKWTSPVEVVKADPVAGTCEQVFVRQGIKPPLDQRGGSQLVPWGDGYISISHEVNLYNNYLGQKDGVYRHRLCVWSSDLDLIGISPEPLTFLDGNIEFCTGAAVYGDDLLITFGFQDNAAYILQMPGSVVNELIEATK